LPKKIEPVFGFRIENRISGFRLTSLVSFVRIHSHFTL